MDFFYVKPQPDLMEFSKNPKIYNNKKPKIKLFVHASKYTLSLYLRNLIESFVFLTLDWYLDYFSVITYFAK